MIAFAIYRRSHYAACDMNTIRCFWPGIVVLCLATVSCRHVEHHAAHNGRLAETQPGLMKSEFIYETAPFPECHASTIVETKSGLVAAWFGGTRERHPDVGIWLARHVSGGWTVPVEVANGVQSPTNRYPCWNP